MTDDPVSILFRLQLGPWLTPLRGKIPVLDAWNEQPPVDETRVREWLAGNFNLGLRCGARSGVVVLDDDQARNGVLDGYALPPTGLSVLTPTGGRHAYYRCPAGGLHNSASKLAPYVDVRGDGGQVAVPPSIHPTARAPYRWEATGEPAALPAEALAALTETRARPAVIDMSAPCANGYAETALVREVGRVRAAPEGTRNATLNRAAFSLGQLVAGGALNGDTVRSDLISAAQVAGLDTDEATATVASGLRGGSASPRSVPARPAPASVRAPTDVLVPGSHVLPDGEYIEVGNHHFAGRVLDALDPSTLYRRSTAVGELHDGQFAQVDADRLRSIVDSSVRLTAGKDGDDGPVVVYRTCSRDNASVLLKYAAVRGRARELKHIARYPVCIGPDFVPARPGWNADHGVYLACQSVPEPLALDESRAVLEDLVCDFPFAEAADRANFFGLLVTVVLRPAIAEPVPMHMLGAPVAGSGKSKLAEIVLGCGLLGRPLPATQIGVREEEREKRITAAMISGDSTIHLDNLHDFIDSAALASLLTCSVYRARELGHSRMLSLPNDATVVGSGNNVHATDEISRRIVPIMLQPNTESPETRQDYRHPMLRAYVESQIDRTRAAVFGLVSHWRATGRPLGSVAVGSFERWASVVGGIMVASGYPEWCSNLATWRKSADDTNAELRAFVQLWSDAYQGAWVSTSDLFKLADDGELFTRRLTQQTERGRQTAFGRVVISAIANRVVAGKRIEVDGQGKRRRAKLVGD